MNRFIPGVYSLFVISFTARAAEPAFHVSACGNDRWPGRLQAPNKERNDGPFATITRARDAVRELKKAGALQQPVTVLIHGGVYRLAETVAFAPEDSGTVACPITRAAAPGQTPVFSGGRAITGWQKAGGKLWKAQIADAASGKWHPRQLFVNGRRAVRARTPNDGYFRGDGPLAPLTRDRKTWQPEMKIGFKFKDGDLKRWDDLDDANVIVFHSWTASWHHIAALDEQAHAVRFTNPSGWPLSYWEKEQRNHAENFRESPDSPGE